MIIIIIHLNNYSIIHLNNYKFLFIAAQRVLIFLIIIIIHLDYNY